MDLVFSAVRCPSLTLAHPAVAAEISSNAYMGVAMFTCSPGYVVAGPKQIHCLQTGQWSDPAPTCKGLHRNSADYIIICPMGYNVASLCVLVN